MTLENHRQRNRGAVAICVIIIAGLLVSCDCGEMKENKQSDLTRLAKQGDAIPLPPDHIRLKQRGSALQLLRFQVDRGAESDAKKYYSETVSPHLSFLTPETIGNSTIKDLLKYFGYADITPTDLHKLSSVALMAKHSPGDILATRFFAPKITEVSDPPAEIPPSGFGWRKLVRLKARPGSKAADNGIGFLMFLQNFFQKSVSVDPFADDNVSQFNQAMAIRTQLPFTAAKHSVYFLTYGPLVKLDGERHPVRLNGDFQDDGKISFGLDASFDARPDPETGLVRKDYWVPDSCLQCHGLEPLSAKANYLDTDHWFDRVTPDYGLSDAKFKQEDFTALAASPFGVLYDGPIETTSDEFKKAFDVIRTINREIKDQNKLLGEGDDNFQLGAVTKWIDLHEPGASGATHVPPYQRGFGALRWDPGNDNHKKLLYYFNRYCYRCHSSVKYNVFDLQRVKDFEPQMSGRLRNIRFAKSWMPQDRTFPGLQVSGGVVVPTGDLAEFLNLLDQLH